MRKCLPRRKRGIQRSRGSGEEVILAFLRASGTDMEV